MRLVRSAKGGRRWKRNYSFNRGCNASQALCRRARDWPTSAPTMGIFPCGFCSTGALKAPLRLTSTRCRLTTRARRREKERMDFRLCPGLAKIKAEECDAIAIAGMGGETILGILEAAPWTHEDVHTLILQPQTKIDLLRCWLCGHGYRFLSETLVRDKEQLYVVFRVRAGMGQELSEADALTGLLLRSDPLYGEYLSQHLIKLNRARDGLAVSSLADKEARIAHLENLIEEIKRRKGEWEHGNGT